MSFVAFAQRTNPLASTRVNSYFTFNPQGPYKKGMLIQFKVGGDWYHFKVEKNVKLQGGHNASGYYYRKSDPSNHFPTSSFSITDYKFISLVNSDGTY